MAGRPGRQASVPGPTSSPGCSTSPRRKTAIGRGDAADGDIRLRHGPDRSSSRVRALVRPVAAIDAGEDGLETVVVGLRDRVELVIVAAGAVDGQAHEGGHRAGDHVVAVEQPRLQLVDRPFAQLDVADEVPRPGGDEAGRDRTPFGSPGQRTSPANLLADEPAVTAGRR